MRTHERDSWFGRVAPPIRPAPAEGDEPAFHEPVEEVGDDQGGDGAERKQHQRHEEAAVPGRPVQSVEGETGGAAQDRRPREQDSAVDEVDPVRALADEDQRPCPKQPDPGASPSRTPTMNAAATKG